AGRFPRTSARSPRRRAGPASRTGRSARPAGRRPGPGARGASSCCGTRSRGAAWGILPPDRVARPAGTAQGGRWTPAGRAGAAGVWRYLRFSQLGPVRGATVTPDPDDPLRATLRGEITVDVHYGGKATVKELHLVRQTPTAGWTVAPDDVERMARDIGLGT